MSVSPPSRLPEDDHSSPAAAVIHRVRAVRRADEGVPIVFITNMPQYAIEGYKVRALDYMFKPVSWPSFREALARALRYTGHREEGYVLISVRDTKRKIDVAGIYEQDTLLSMGYRDLVVQQILSYWGGMLDLGADTFWEEYDPEKKPEEQYEMYGDPFGKSMCHAWAASPVWLLARGEKS